MKASRIFVVTLFVMLGLVTAALPARAEINTNFVKDFLKRYQPPKVALPAASAAQSAQDVAPLIRSGQLPLTVGELINLVLQNNLDVGLNRLSPLSSLYFIDTMYRPFDQQPSDPDCAEQSKDVRESV